MKQQARKGTDRRCRLDIGEAVKPVEKALDRLAERADKRRSSVARDEDVILSSFARSKELYGMLLFQSFGPGGIQVSLVSQQSSLSEGEMILEDVFCGRKVMLRGARDHQGQRKWQLTRPAGHNSMKF